MLKINSNTVIEDLPIWEVEYTNLPDDDIIKDLKYQEIDFKRQFYVWGNEIGDSIIDDLQLHNIKNELTEINNVIKEEINDISLKIIFI